VSAAPGTETARGLRDAVARRIFDDPDVPTVGDRATLRAAVARALAAEGVVVPPARWARLVRDLVDEFAGLGPVERLLRDPSITDVMVNGPADVWVERDGRVEPSEVRFDDDDHIIRTALRVLGPLGVRLDRSHPWADAVIGDGVRLHALLPPVTPRPVITLRRVPAVVPTWEEMTAGGVLTDGAAGLLRAAVRERRNIVVCGRAGAGKTTLLARLLAEVGGDRVVLIEDAPELHAPSAHVIPLRVRAVNAEGVGRVGVDDLVRNALRMRPDRLVVGEVRGHEVADVLQAMNTGHSGSMTTVHANSATDALVRLEGMALLAGVPLAAVRAQLATALDLVISIDRSRDGRRLEEVVEVAVARDGTPRTGRLWP
jgi:pilus assembly protein CpaF